MDAGNQFFIRDFEIRKFKKFADFKVSNLGHINIVLGNNNSGKTTLLEAIFAFANETKIFPVIANSVLRREKADSKYDLCEKILKCLYDEDTPPFSFEFKGVNFRNEDMTINHSFRPGRIFEDLKPKLFENYEPAPGIILGERWEASKDEPLTFIGEWKVSGMGEAQSQANIIYQKEVTLYSQTTLGGRGGNTISAHFSDLQSYRNSEENAKIYGRLLREDLLEEFKADLNNTFPEIEGITMIPYPDGKVAPVSFKLKNKKSLPIYTFGEGLQRWYHLLGTMILNKNAIHCIEEIDATFHPSAQKELAVNLVRYAQEYNNQLFLNTHDIEFVDNFLAAIYEDRPEQVDEDLVRVITLKTDKEQTRVRVLTGREAYNSRENYKIDLR